MHRISGDEEELRSAEKSCGDALEESSVLPAVHVSLGKIHAAQQQKEKALQHYGAAAELDPLYEGLGRLYERLGEIEKAALSYQRHARLKPDCFSYQNSLGIFNWAQGRYEKAEGHYQSAISLAPNYYRAYTNLGVLYLRQRRYREAAALLGRSLSLKPTALLKPTAH